MRTISVFLGLMAIWLLSPMNETRADYYDDQIRDLEDQIVECRDRLGRGSPACESMRKHNLRIIQQLYQQKQRQGGGATRYDYGSRSGSGRGSGSCDGCTTAYCIKHRGHDHSH